MGRHLDDFKARNVEVLIILGATVEQADRYCESLHVPYRVLADPERAIYHQYGLERSFFLQRTASVIVDCNGMVSYIKTTTNPMTWLQESHEVLDFIKTMKAGCQPAAN